MESVPSVLVTYHRKAPLTRDAHSLAAASCRPGQSSWGMLSIRSFLYTAMLTACAASASTHVRGVAYNSMAIAICGLTIDSLSCPTAHISPFHVEHPPTPASGCLWIERNVNFKLIIPDISLAHSRAQPNAVSNSFSSSSSCTLPTVFLCSLSLSAAPINPVEPTSPPRLRPSRLPTSYVDVL
ncbi:hypothetical protein PYCCODRAFT_977164 [Trametes coccinea BRFM310]|uniref:Uncharacterized protein n=1 Tax=Trametes coccinea (strain BRFM310) TaxID=1353009 RepID=A0A1Y2IBX2_TRAC3|nr:hypothetical protein PYCCODRAFT_977164 [Trametes coccinea BRFM310]